MLKQFASDNTATAVALKVPLDDAGFPPAGAWETAPAVHFDHDWRGENSDPERATGVRLFYTPSMLYLRFVARFRVLTVFDDSEPTGRRDHLWDRDVAEAFLQPQPSHLRHYKEFEVSPNGFWIDLDINNGERQDLHSGLSRRVTIAQSTKSWTADLAIPMKSLCSKFDPAVTWRANFFRAEGTVEPRFYSAWRATLTPQPNFHVPELFGYLKFAS